jgi:hypothetical protein
MPNTDRFDNTPFFRAAVAADVEALKVMVGHGAKLDQMPPVEAEPERKPGDITVGGRRANPNAGRTPAIVAMTGGRGPGMTGGTAYIRDGAVPYREPGSRKPEDAVALLLAAGANPNATGLTAAACCTRPRERQPRDDSRWPRPRWIRRRTRTASPRSTSLASSRPPRRRRAGGSPFRGRRGGRGANRRTWPSYFELMKAAAAPPTQDDQGRRFLASALTLAAPLDRRRNGNRSAKPSPAVASTCPATAGD